MSQVIHQGRNIKRFREMLGIKQETLAQDLGEDWNQKKISLLEQKELIDEELLKQVAEVLKVPKEAIENFDEEAAISFIGNTFNNHDNSATLNGITIHYTPTFNPIDKLVETLEENKKLYERLLASEKEKNAILEKLVALKG